MITQEQPNIQINGDIVVANTEPLVPDLVPTYEGLVDGTMYSKGWIDTGFRVSAARALPGMKLNNSFGHLVLGGGTMWPNLLMKSGESVDEVHQLKTIFIDEGHTVVHSLWVEWGTRGNLRHVDCESFDAFALVPGRYPRSGGSLNGIKYAPDFKKADMYTKSKNWKLFRGLFLKSR